jgi:hypothetical protein
MTGTTNPETIPTRRILHRWTEVVLWEGSAATVRDALHAALASGADLRGADLRDANLRGANLGDANLRGANLRGANLGDANLGGANLGDANLRGADLRDANLRGANLGDANLRGANLRGANLGDANLGGANLRGADLGDANLGDANLRGADLRGADLGDANLAYFRDDFWAVLSAAPAEVPALIAALREGRVEGSTYEGACACLVGTIANARGCEYSHVTDLAPNSWRPAEQWFLGIHTGDTPETNAWSARAVAWAETWLTRMQSAFGAAPASDPEAQG